MSTNVPSKIIGIWFSMLSPEEIEKNSVLEITNRETYNNNKPVTGGLFDSRMGVSESGNVCPTDGYTYINTPGDFGHKTCTSCIIYTTFKRNNKNFKMCVF